MKPSIAAERLLKDLKAEARARTALFSFTILDFTGMSFQALRSGLQGS